MSFARIFMRIAVLTGMVTASSATMAGPVRCSVSNQDSTCVGHLTTAWQTPPPCPNQPGWTTAAPAQWIGSQYSAPQCNYQAPPGCPAGTDQLVSPTWNGSSWTGLICQPKAPPPPPTQPPGNLASICESAIAAEMARAGFNGTNGTYRGVWGALQGPYTLGGGQVYPPEMFAGMGGSMRGGQGPGDFYYVRDLGNPSAGGATGGNGIGVCWFQSGTANLTGYDYLEDLSSDGG
ncbi:hypothetical protein LMG28727_06093 [Paraburkholderia kirstenboschensis]|nr:hypothetical protein LMG28727_06093 [Paraburkholderia kirstenboschensis]